MALTEKTRHAHALNTAVFDGLYAQLNDEQRRAVDALEGPVMVLAGPGTGKTQVLAMRIANILRETQMDPWNILCLTFTESAAAAMRDRLLGIIGEAAYYVRIHTFHSFCNDVIQEHPDVFLMGSQWQVLSDVERVSLIRDLLDELPAASKLKPFGQPYMYVPDIIQNIQWLKKEGITPDTLRDLLRSQAALVRDAKEPLAAFGALAASERSDADCRALASTLRSVCTSLPLGATLWPSLEALFARYEAAAAAADGKRTAGKARTQLKNDLKKLYERLVKQSPRQRDLRRLYERYQSRLAELARYDYEDMIMRVLERFRTDDTLLAQYQEQFQYILVDEYQDTNGAQNEVVRLLGSFYPNPNIFVVGDDKQSIFRFQGASLENLLSFYEHYRDDVAVITLRINYRSQQTILDAATSVISHNTAAIAKTIPAVTQDLTAAGGTPAPLAHCPFDTEDEEDYFVARKIQELLQAGVQPREIAVLYRFNRDVESLLDVLLRMKVPVHVAAGENVLGDRRVRQLLRVLSYVAHEERDDVLADILAYDFWRLDPLHVLQVLTYAGHTRTPLLRVIADAALLAQAGVKYGEPFESVARRLAAWRRVAANDTLQSLFDAVLQESGLLEHILRDERQLLVLHNITAVFDELRRLNRARPQASVRDFMHHIRLLEEHGLPLIAPQWETKSNAVQLMTAHRAKGLEFEHVFLIRLVDRHWGNVRERRRLSLPLGILAHDPIAGQENNEDERRLFYVALTRAKQQLYLSQARLSDTRRERASSLFVRELPASMMAEVDTTETEDEALSRLAAVRVAQPRQAVTKDIREWLAGQIERYTMSVTHLNNYLECPRLFYYRNLLRVPSAKTKHMAFGTAVHNALRDFFVQFNEMSELPPVDYVVAQFRYYLEREILSDRDRADSLARGEELLRRYYKRYADEFAPHTLLEYDFRSHGVHVDDLRLTGKLDKVEVLDGGKQVRVVDYKTGDPDNAAKYVKENGPYRRQLTFYKLLCDGAPRFTYEMIAGELDFVQPSTRTGKFVKKRIEITPAEVTDLQRTIRRVWGEIKKLAFLGAEGCGECEYCQRLG